MTTSVHQTGTRLRGVRSWLLRATAGVAEARPTARRSRSDRIIASVTLTDLPASAAVSVIAGLIGVSWLAAFYLGGGTIVAPHWFYIPIFLAVCGSARLGLWWPPASPLSSRGHCCLLTPPRMRRSR
jgi:hypothetical protein